MTIDDHAGPAGPQGETGETGQTGQAGETGKTGQAGQVGQVGETGARGTAGLRGPRGDDGEDTAQETDTLRVVTLVVLAILAIVVGALVWFLLTYVQEQRLLSECHRVAFNETNSSLRTIVGAAARDRADLLAVLNTITDQASTREARAAAMESYKATLAATNQSRASNPLPERTC